MTSEGSFLKNWPFTLFYLCPDRTSLVYIAISEPGHEGLSDKCGLDGSRVCLWDCNSVQLCIFSGKAPFSTEGGLRLSAACSMGRHCWFPCQRVGRVSMTFSAPGSVARAELPSTPNTAAAEAWLWAWRLRTRACSWVLVCHCQGSKPSEHLSSRATRLDSSCCSGSFWGWADLGWAELIGLLLAIALAGLASFLRGRLRSAPCQGTAETWERLFSWWWPRCKREEQKTEDFFRDFLWRLFEMWTKECASTFAFYVGTHQSVPLSAVILFVPRNTEYLKPYICTFVHPIS